MHLLLCCHKPEQLLIIQDLSMHHLLAIRSVEDVLACIGYVRSQLVLLIGKW